MARKPSSKRIPGEPAVELPASQHAASAGGTSPQDSSSATGEDDGSTEGDAVGYRRPPVHSRFKKGQSGNPRGRAKRSRNLRTVMKQVLDEDMLVREGSRVRRMPAGEALVRTTMSRALKGDPKSMTSLLILLRHAGYGADVGEDEADPLANPEIEAIVDDILTRAGSNGGPTEKPTGAAASPPTKPKE